MASTDTWNEFLAKLDNSPNGRKSMDFVKAMQAIEKTMEQPATPLDGFGTDLGGYHA